MKCWGQPGIWPLRGPRGCVVREGCDQLGAMCDGPRACWRRVFLCMTQAVTQRVHLSTSTPLNGRHARTPTCQVSVCAHSRARVSLPPTVVALQAEPRKSCCTDQTDRQRRGTGDTHTHTHAPPLHTHRHRIRPSFYDQPTKPKTKKDASVSREGQGQDGG